MLKIKEDLSKNNVNIIYIPVLYPGWWCVAKWYQIPLGILQSIPILLWLKIKYNIKIYHCRSYPITLPALIVKKIIGVKVIFDPRSDFLNENISRNIWNINSLSYKIWRYMEYYFLKKSDITIAISESYQTYYSKICKTTYFNIIPNNVDFNRLKIDNSFKISFKNNYNIKDNAIIFVYCGSIGDKYWNDAKIYAQYIKEFRKLYIPHKYLFITQDQEILKKVFMRYEINNDEYIIVSANYNQVPLYLSIGDIGMQLMNSIDIRLGIKTVEYLAMGLPVIVNENVIAAKQLIEQYNLGLIYSLGITNIDDLINLIKNKDVMHNKCIDISHKLFSNESVAKKYLNVYEKLLN